MAKGNNANPVVVAIARELVGFMWAMATQVPGAPQASRWRRIDAQAVQVANDSRQRRRPGVGYPAAALRGRQVFSSLD
jgi:hypothetical protein